MAAPAQPSETPPDPDPELPPELNTRSAMTFAGCLYLIMIFVGVIWLWLRERLGVVPSLAVGQHGLLVSAGVGLTVGLLGTLTLALASRLKSVERCEKRVAAMLGPLEETPLLALATLSALAEEFFFRLAVQDALGLPAAVALYVLLNTGPGFWVWSSIALISALLFGALVALGYGLLAATVAHAVINYLSLRRILPT